MHPIHYIIFLWFGISHQSCTTYPLSGHIDMNDSAIKNMVYLIDPVDFQSLASSYRGHLIDSAAIDDQGHFFFKKMPQHTEKKLYLLTLQNTLKKYPLKLENDHPEHFNYLPFVYMSSGRVSISSSAKQYFKDAMIQGTIDDNKDVMYLIHKRMELWNMFQQSLKSDLETFLIDNEKARFQFQQGLMASVPDEQGVLLSALALRWAAPNHDYERIPELVRETCQKVQKSDPKHPWTVQVCALSRSLPLSAGLTFPDVALPLSNGDTVQLFSILGEKITLIDFWASWFAPCRKENREVLVSLWEKYHPEGFQIIGHALDASEKGWKNAVAKDGAHRWLHSSYLQGDISPLMEQLKLTTIPCNYIMNKQGTILAKNLHGEDLNVWLKKYFE